jgi:hypothetical protein
MLSPGTSRTCLRYEIVLAKLPGRSATVLVAFAATAGTPAAIRAGNVRKLPPPAIALMAPAKKADRISKASVNLLL